MNFAIVLLDQPDQPPTGNIMPKTLSRTAVDDDADPTQYYVEAGLIVSLRLNPLTHVGTTIIVPFLSEETVETISSR